MSWLFVLVLILMAGTVVVMLAGIVNLAKGGEGSGARSNKLMGWRIGLQGAALGALALLFYLDKNPH